MFIAVGAVVDTVVVYCLLFVDIVDIDTAVVFIAVCCCLFVYLLFYCVGTTSLLLVSHSETTSLSERVNNLMKQLEQERASHSEAMQVLQVEVEGGNMRVTQLEHALDLCRSELEGHVSRVGEAMQVHKSEVEELKKQVR